MKINKKRNKQIDLHTTKDKLESIAGSLNNYSFLMSMIQWRVNEMELPTTVGVHQVPAGILKLMGPLEFEISRYENIGECLAQLEHDTLNTEERELLTELRAYHNDLREGHDAAIGFLAILTRNFPNELVA